ncbi:uncharacterized protein METZ01_LOCUS495320 [marine metagenome]|uniref:Uncharacterized protein n=1 Tax=marine metagenome TaxID=408172 RepID=A0A383DD94_9ZZZZ
MVGLGTLEEGILMRIPDYRNVHGVKSPNQWTPKASRVDQVHEDEFEKELEGSIRKRKSESKKRKEKLPIQDEGQDEMQLEVDHLFAEYEQKVKEGMETDLDGATPNNGNRFSSWG